MQLILLVVRTTNQVRQRSHLKHSNVCSAKPYLPAESYPWLKWVPRWLAVLALALGFAFRQPGTISYEPFGTLFSFSAGFFPWMLLVFVVLLPYSIDALGKMLHVPARFTTYMFAIQYATFGLIMIIFLVLEPGGLVAIWNRISSTNAGVARRRSRSAGLTPKRASSSVGR